MSAEKGQRTSLSERSNLKFPVARVSKIVKTDSMIPRVNTSASVALAALLEYVVAEIVEKGIDEMHRVNKNRSRLMPIDLSRGINADMDLFNLFDKTPITDGHVLPYVKPVVPS